jgi:putative membrane protein
MAGPTGATARLAYLPAHEVEPLRDRLLALSRSARAEDGEEGKPEVDAPAAPVEERVLARVSTGRLIVSILISDVGLIAELVMVALIVTAIVSPHLASGLVTGGLVWIISVFTLVWRRFNQLYHLTVAERPDGLHLYGGLIALTAEVIRPGRVQAVRLVEPFLWRTVGWCRLEIDLAGRQRGKGEGEAEKGQLRTLLPVGRHELAYELLDRLVPDRPRELARAPRRTMWKSPLRYRALAWGRTDTCVATKSGRLRRVTSWVPLEKAQSLRYVQGPVQRRLRLASVHVDTAGRGVHATLRDRDMREATTALTELTELARTARRRPAPA